MAGRETIFIVLVLVSLSVSEQPPQMESKLDKQIILSTGPQNSFQLSCRAKADPPASYQWFRGDDKLESTSPGVELTGGKLLFSNPSLSHEGYYHCLASNKFGVAKSTVVHLTPVFNQSPEGTIPPSFLRSPETEIKAFGGTAEFDCTASGEPKPEITWYKNGKVLEGETGKKLSIRNIGKIDVANYACNISNIAGYEYKDVYLNILRQTARIKSGPKEEQTVSKNSNATIQCEVEGYPKPQITWEFNDTEIVSGDKYVVNEKTGDLVVLKVGEDDQGIYRCTATNEKDITDFKEGTLIVKTLTTIDDGPRDIEQTVYSTVTMKCTVMWDMSQELIVTWKKDNKDLRNIGTKEEDRIYEDKNHALTIKDLTMDDAGDYTCWARTSTSEDTDNGKLVVLGIPPKIQQPEPVEAMEGGDISLACVVDEGFPAPTVSWYKDGVIGALSSGYRIQIGEDNTLTLKDAVKEDSGLYRCKAENNMAKVEVDAKVDVRSQTAITSNAVSYLYKEGQEVLINCEVQVDPALRKHLIVTWYHGQNELKDLHVQQITYLGGDKVMRPESASYLANDADLGSGDNLEDKEEHRVLLANSTLKISGLKKEDIGEYRCEANLSKPGLMEGPVVSSVSEIYSFTPFPWWIIVVVIIVLIITVLLVIFVCKAKSMRNTKGYYDVSDIEASGKKHNKSDIYYMPEDLDSDSIMNESDNFPLTSSTPAKKTPIFTPKTIRHLNNMESTKGSVGSLLEDDEFLGKGMDEDGSFTERYAE